MAAGADVDDRSLDPSIAGGGAAYKALLRDRGFRRLALAMFSSSLGDWIGILAILALTTSILGGTRAGLFGLAGVMIARVLPTLMLGPLAGVYADRWNRKRLLIATDIGRALIMGAIPFSDDYLQLFVASFLVEVLSMLFAPARDATIPNLVPKRQLLQANQLTLIVTYGTLPLGGVFFALFTAIGSATLGSVEFLQDRPEALAIWVNAATFLVSALLVAGIDIPQTRRQGDKDEQRGAWLELKEGFSFIMGHRLVRSLVLGVMAAFWAAGVVFALGERFAAILNAEGSGFGVLVAAVGIGLVAGLIGGGPLAKRIAVERLFAPAIGLAGAGLIGTAFMPRLDLACIPALIMGAGAGVGFLSGYTILMQRSDDTIRGRTFAAFNSGVRLSLFVALVLAPLLAGVLGPEVANAQTGIYGYQLGSIRSILMAAGAVAAAGALWTSRQISQALKTEPDLRLGTTVSGSAPSGLFIVLEGGEGAGKTTQLRLLRAFVERRGWDVVTTREPGGTPLGDDLRRLVLDPSRNGMSDRAEALLYAAARAQHVESVLRPTLEKGGVVLCDRYVDSSIVYQGAARGLGESEVEELNRWSTDGLDPDLTIVLDVDATLGLRRAARAQIAGVASGADVIAPMTDPAGPDRLEMEGAGFHEVVNEGFRRRAAADPDRYLVIDASLPAEQVHAAIRAAVEVLLDEIGPNVD